MNPPTSAGMAEDRAPRPPVPSPPSREVLLADMLSQTGRHGVPIRRRLLQSDSELADGTRAAPLSSLLKARDTASLDAYLLIHAMASSSSPYRAAYFSSSWVRLMRFEESAEPAAASSRWSKAVTRLVDLKLLYRHRAGNVMEYFLLDEAGTDQPYSRPTKLAHGRWFSLPYQYWLDGWDQLLTGAEKVMLLISLDQPDGFSIPYERFPTWYGVSASTAKRGLTGLVARGILDMRQDFHVSGRSPTGWLEVRSYTTQGFWSKQSRDELMKTRAKKHRPVVFAETEAAPKAK